MSVLNELEAVAAYQLRFALFQYPLCPLCAGLHFHFLSFSHSSAQGGALAPDECRKIVSLSFVDRHSTFRNDSVPRLHPR